jgi:bisanhydrobacterioruberin hydratase
MTKTRNYIDKIIKIPFNKKLFILSIIFFVSGLITALTPIQKNLWIISVLFIIMFAVPSFYGVISTVGKRKGWVIIVSLSIFAVVFESFAILTGFPYGKFTYTDLIGPKIFGIVPISIAFAWSPLVIGSCVISNLYVRNQFLRIFLSAIILMAIDMVLDPGSVALQFWSWEGMNFLYTVPLTNFLGWLLSGLIGSSIIFIVTKKQIDSVKQSQLQMLLISSYLILIYWTTVDLFKSLFICVGIGIALLVMLLRILLKTTNHSY